MSSSTHWRTYRQLNYVVPPRCGWQIIELSFAVTPDEIVRRTRDHSDRSVVYETADLCELIGEFEPWNRTPSVPHDVWTRVEPDEETP